MFRIHGYLPMCRNLARCYHQRQSEPSLPASEFRKVRSEIGLLPLEIRDLPKKRSADDRVLMEWCGRQDSRARHGFSFAAHLEAVHLVQAAAIRAERSIT